MQKRKTSMMVLQCKQDLEFVKKMILMESSQAASQVNQSYFPLVIMIHRHIPHLRLNPLSSIEYFALTSEDQP